LEGQRWKDAGKPVVAPAQPALPAAPAQSDTPRQNRQRLQEEIRGVLIMKESMGPKPYMNPYLAGVILGLTLLASYLVLGAGLGASAGIARIAAYLESGLASSHVSSSEYLEPGERSLSITISCSCFSACLQGA